MKKKFDFHIVGAGFFGSVIAERLANDLGLNILIIDKRNHIGGNCFSEIDFETGIEYHKYGTHIFHTSNYKVMKYLLKFCELNNYKHQVFSKYREQIYSLPFNLLTINQIYKKNLNPDEAKKLIKKETSKIQFLETDNLKNKALLTVGPKIYQKLIKGYTTKQWGKDPKFLPQSIINRIPLRFNFNSDYFLNSKWQGIPLNGYTDIFKKMLSNKNITIKLNKEFCLNDLNSNVPTLYTGPLDSLLNYKYGSLEWRSLKFKKKIIKKMDFQGNSVINYSDIKTRHTRIHEPKHLHPERNYTSKKTLIIHEYPSADNKNPYYPINDKKNRKIHRKYKKLLKEYKNFYYGGRLADYAYYDMDMTISAALQLYENKIKKNF